MQAVSGGDPPRGRGGRDASGQGPGAGSPQELTSEQRVGPVQVREEACPVMWGLRGAAPGLVGNSVPEQPLPLP